MAGKVTELNPVGSPPKVTAKALAPRPATLDGKTVYLVDVRFDNSGVFMEQLENWFSEHMPKVRTHLVHWKEPFQHDIDLAKEIAEKGDAAVFGVGL